MIKAGIILTILSTAAVVQADAGSPQATQRAENRPPIIAAAAYPGQTGLATMQQLLQSGANVNTRDAEGFTPLMIAANWGNTEMVKLLLEAGADVLATTNSGTNALHSVACAQIIHTGDATTAAQDLTHIAAMLLAAGADINQATADGVTPLIVAANYNNILLKPFLQAGAKIPTPGDAHYRKHIEELVRHCSIETLLEHGLDANYRTDNGRSLLQTAVAQRNEKAVEALILNGANVNNPGNGVDILWYAIEHRFTPNHGDRLAIARRLLAAGANPLQYYNGETTLHACAEYGDVPLMQLLLQHSPQAVDIRNDSNNTPLHLAARNAHTGMIRLLINAGANVNAVNKSATAQLSGGGFCVAALAAGSAKDEAAEALELLLDAGAAFDTAAQKNIMHAALCTGSPQMVRLLLDKGIDANTRLAHGVPLLQIATNHADPAVLQLLLDAGADANAVNDAGLTALHVIVQHPLTEPRISSIIALLNAGANPHCKDHYGRTPLDCAPQATQDWLLRQIAH
ncbi:MAG: hypothetical protein E7033_05060 [Akkermansiaceae bacterium]|nr:hypothetical protein [Akkermansiaceae bacterium]